MPETEIKELTAVSSKRRSLGQLKLKLERQITAVETLCRMIDPRGDGSLRRSTEQSHNDLNKEHKCGTSIRNKNKEPEYGTLIKSLK